MKIKKGYLCLDSVAIQEKGVIFKLPDDVYTVHLCFKTKKAMYKMHGKKCRYTECKVRVEE